jgi:phospholipase/lecithinase/hemolysin
LAWELRRLDSQTTGVDLIEFDLFASFRGQIENPEDYGYTNVDDACIYVFSQGGVVNPECADFPLAAGFAFWDEIHPQTAAHQTIGAEMVGTLLS